MKSIRQSIFFMILAAMLILGNDCFSISRNDRNSKQCKGPIKENQQFLEQCSFFTKTHYSYITNQTLLSNTGFQASINDLLYNVRNIGTQTFNSNASQSYQISFINDYKDPFYYSRFNLKNINDSIRINQTLILFNPGEIQFIIKLNWKKNTSGQIIVGSTFVKATTQNISYKAQINTNNINASQYINIKIINPESIQFDFVKAQTTILPQTTKQIDISNINKFLLQGTVRKEAFLSLIRNYLNLKFSERFVLYFNDKNIIPFDNIIKYKPSYNDFEISFISTPSSLEFGYNYFKYSYKLQAKSTYYHDAIWDKCKDIQRTEPLPVEKYGKTQQYSSYCFYENVLRFLIDNYQLYTRLQRESWQSKLFHFQATDLFNIIPKVKNYFKHYQAVNGSCLADRQRVKISKSQSNIFMVKIKHNCFLNVSQTKIQQFNITLQMDVKARIREKDILLYLDDYKFNVNYKEIDQFKIENIQLANKIIGISLDRLYKGTLYGSNWPIPLGIQNIGILSLDNQLLFYDKNTI